MKYALVCKNEIREQGYRVAEIVDAIPYEPAPDHMWVECADDLVADAKWFDPNDKTYKDFPPPPIPVNPQASANQPTTTGTQTI
jgi:hypothetical protein